MCEQMAGSKSVTTNGREEREREVEERGTKLAGAAVPGTRDQGHIRRLLRSPNLSNQRPDELGGFEEYSLFLSLSLENPLADFTISTDLSAKKPPPERGGRPSRSRPGENLYKKSSFCSHFYGLTAVASGEKERERRVIKSLSEASPGLCLLLSKAVKKSVA